MRKTRGYRWLFHDRSPDEFVAPTLCMGNMHHYCVRKEILNYLVSRGRLFRGVVVDLGCGSSPYRATVMGHAESSITSYVRVDLGSEGYHAGNRPDLTWDGVNIPMGSSTVDCVLMTEVVEHLPRVGDVMADALRVLRPGGVVIGTVPFLYPLHELPHDYRRCTPEGLRQLARQAGFQKAEVTQVGGWDRSLAHMLGMWLTFRAMPRGLRPLLKVIVYPAYRLLLHIDGLPHSQSETSEDRIFVGLGFVFCKEVAPP